MRPAEEVVLRVNQPEEMTAALIQQRGPALTQYRSMGKHATGTRHAGH